MHEDLKNKVVIITGGGGGIGREIAIQFSALGSKVVVCDIDQTRGNETIDMLKGEHLLIIKDLSVVEECKSVVAETISTFGQLDVLVNSAGIIERTPIKEVDEAHWERTMNTNLKSIFFLTQAACNAMDIRNYGRVINFTSQAGFSGGLASSAVYAISKGGVLTLTKSFARFYAESGITVNAIAPGAIDTSMLNLSKEQLNEIIRLIPMKRIGRTDEIAETVLFLASEKASYITGATIDVTGGQMMR